MADDDLAYFDDAPLSFGEVARRVIEELAAMCPSEERLAAYLRSGDKDEFSDVVYHVEEARCRFCLEAIDELRNPSTDNR